MRLVFPLLLILLGVALVGFLITNSGQKVDVTLGSTTYDDVSLFIVVFTSLVIGVAFAAVVALIEGATIRLGNRRLRREIQRLETENSFLRTQPRPSSEPDAIEPEPPRRAGPTAERGERAVIPTAPVYEVGTNETGD